MGRTTQVSRLLADRFMAPSCETRTSAMGRLEPSRRSSWAATARPIRHVEVKMGSAPTALKASHNI
jgi:hypothetical protein